MSIMMGKHPDIGLFKLLMYSRQFYEEWRQKIVGVLLRFRDPDKEKGIRKRIKDGHIWFCERHFKRRKLSEQVSHISLRDFHLLPYVCGCVCVCVWGGGGGAKSWGV